MLIESVCVTSSNNRRAHPPCWPSLTLTKSLFLIDDDVFDLELDEEFDFSCEFASPENELQGQLYDIVSVLPADVKSKIRQEWVQQAVRGHLLRP